jgi:hypothetical protein
MGQRTLPDTKEWMKKNCLYDDNHLNLLLAYIYFFNSSSGPKTKQPQKSDQIRMLCLQMKHLLCMNSMPVHSMSTMLPIISLLYTVKNINE